MRVPIYYLMLYTSTYISRSHCILHFLQKNPSFLSPKDERIALLWEVLLLKIRKCAKPLAPSLLTRKKKYWVALNATKTTEDIVYKMVKMEAGHLCFVNKFTKLVFPSFEAKNK